MSKKQAADKKNTIQATDAIVSATLVEEVRSLIQSTRANVAQSVNSALVLLYWEIRHENPF